MTGFSKTKTFINTCPRPNKMSISTISTMSTRYRINIDKQIHHDKTHYRYRQFRYDIDIDSISTNEDRMKIHTVNIIDIDNNNTISNRYRKFLNKKCMNKQRYDIDSKISNLSPMIYGIWIYIKGEKNIIL